MSCIPRSHLLSKQMIHFHTYVSMSKLFYRFLTRKSLNLRKKFVQNFTRCSSEYAYEIPEHFQQSFYLANATLHENVNWYLHHALEVSFDQFVGKIQTESPSFTNEKAISAILNRISVLNSCNSVLELNVPLRKDNGRIEIIKGFCAKHGVHERLHLGGITLSSTLEKSDVEASASLATYRHAIGNIPCFGSHCGMQIHPAQYTAEELRRLLSNFLSTLIQNNFFGIQRNIFESELESTHDWATWICEEYLKIKGNTDPDGGCVTGKSIMNNGLQDYLAVSGDGIIYAIEYFFLCKELMEKVGMTKGLCDKTYIIKGLGLLSMYVAEMLSKTGCKCIGIIDGATSVYDANGINVQEALAHRKKHDSLINYSRNYEPSKTLLEVCDILVVADESKTLNCYAVPHLRAKCIVEAATGAVTPTAHKILLAKGHFVIPDVYIKVITSIAAFLEYTKCTDIAKNLQCRHLDSKIWYEQDVIYPYGGRRAVSGGRNYPELVEDFDHSMVNSVIQTIVRDSATKILRILGEYNLAWDIRTAAYILALQNLFENPSNKTQP